MTTLVHTRTKIATELQAAKLEGFSAYTGSYGLTMGQLRQLVNNDLRRIGDDCLFIDAQVKSNVGGEDRAHTIELTFEEI